MRFVMLALCGPGGSSGNYGVVAFVLLMAFALSACYGGMNVGSRVYNFPPAATNGGSVSVTDASYTGANTQTVSPTTTLNATIPAGGTSPLPLGNVNHSPMILGPGSTPAMMEEALKLWFQMHPEFTKSPTQ